MSDLTTMGDEELLLAWSRDNALHECDDSPHDGNLERRAEILRRMACARIDGKAVSCQPGASGWSARDEACLRAGGAD